MKKNTCLVLSLLCSNYGNATLQLSHTELNTLAMKYGTDKGSEGFVKENYACNTNRPPHNYACKYDFYFSSVKNQPIKFLEIGFFHGASARMWQEYFPLAELHFMEVRSDLLKNYATNFPSRCHFHLADQSNPDDLLKFITTAGGDFDIIIDDGGHSMEQQITSFKILFPFVKKGGVYAIEDLHTSYWRSHGGHGTLENPKAEKGSTICFLQQLIHELNFIGAKTGCANKTKCSESTLNELNYYQRHIKSIHFYDSMCFIFKE